MNASSAPWSSTPSPQRSISLANPLHSNVLTGRAARQLNSYFLMFCLFLFLFNNLNVLVIGAFTSELYVPRLEILVAEVLTFTGAVMMYPFFICTFRITSAEQIICKLGAMALSATDPGRNSSPALVAGNKPKVRACSRALQSVLACERLCWSSVYSTAPCRGIYQVP